MMPAPTVTVVRQYNGNTYDREARNGRVYSGVYGWRWFPLVGGELIEGTQPEGYTTKREALRDAERVLNR